MTDTEQPESLPSASNVSPADGEAAPPADGAAHGAQRISGAGCKVLLVLALIGCAVLGIMLGVTRGHLADAREAGKKLTLNLNVSSREVSRLKRNLDATTRELDEATSKLALMMREQVDTELQLVEAQREWKKTERALAETEQWLDKASLELSQCESANRDMAQHADALARRVRNAESETKRLSLKLGDAESKLNEVERFIRQGKLGLTSIPIGLATQFGSRVVFDHEDLVRKYNRLADDYNDLRRRFNDCAARSQQLEHLVDMVALKVGR